MSAAAWIAELIDLLGAGVVTTQGDELASFAYDQWPLAVKWKNREAQPYRPEAVVRPATTEQVSRLLTWASQKRIAVTPRGAGSGVTGAAIPLAGGIGLDLMGMNRLLVLDETNLLVRAQAGKIGGELEQELNLRGYTLHHSPQSLDRSTVGGWVATRASGQFSSRWGSIEDLISAFTVVLPTGEVVETLPAPRAAMGPDLKHLFIGSEGGLGVIVDVTLKIFPLPEHSRLEAVRFGDLSAGLDAVRVLARADLRPFLVRLYDPDESRSVLREPGFAGCCLFLGFEGSREVAEAEYRVCLEMCVAGGGQVLGPEPVSAWMERRFDFSAVEAALAKPGGYAETIEVAHFWDRISETYAALRAQLTPLAERLFGHFSHVYPQGTSLYMILMGTADDDQQAEERLESIWETSMQVCLEQGAALSHHHGVGLARLPYIRAGLGSGMAVLERLKAALDPAGIMNPGKLGLPWER
jgi:alkyldihydroxyacetonephosphate synthase